MAKTKQPSEKELRSRAAKQLYLENNGLIDSGSGLSPEQLSNFVSGANASISLDNGGTELPDYMGGVSPDFGFTNYERSRYDDNVRMETLTTPGALDNMRAENQGIASSLANSTMNFLGKTAVNVVGGVVGAIYGAGSALANNQLDKLWDNDVTTALDNASDAIGEAFKVYKSSDYNDKFLLNKMVSNPLMFADEFMDTLSFTAGAVVTELLTSGLASGTLLPRASQYINKLLGTAKSLDTINDIGNIARGIERAATINSVTSGLEKAAKLSRQLATGAFWEASVEARHLNEEMINSMTNDYIQEMNSQGYNITADQIPEDVRADIEDRAKNASAATFALNVGLVGFSNLSQFPTIFKTMGNAKKAAASNLVTDITEDGVRYATKQQVASKLEKSLAKTWAAVKNPFMEGFVEEGGQGVISGTMGSFFDRKNDIDGGSEIETFLNSFGKSFNDTYFTKEGLNEVLMGALIGGVGSPGAGVLSVLGKDSAIGKHGFTKTTDAEGNEKFVRKEIWDGGVVGGLRQFNQENQEAAELAEYLNSQPDLVKALKVNYDAQVRAHSLNRELDEAIDNNDHFEFQNAKDNILYNYVSSRLDLGMRDDLDFKVNELKNMSAEEFFVTFKGEDESSKTSLEDKQIFKDDSIENIQKNIDAVNRAKNTVNNFLVDLPDSPMKEAVGQDMAYYLSRAEMMDTREKSIYDTLHKRSNRSIVKPTINGTTIKTAIKNLEKLVTEDSDSNLKNRLKSLKEYQKKYGDNLSSNFITSVIQFSETNPSEFKALERDLDLMLKDLPKIEAYKTNLLKLYDKLNNEKNFNAYGKYLDRLDEKRQEQASQNAKDIEDTNNKVAEKKANDVAKQQAKESTKQSEKEFQDNLDEVTPEKSSQETLDEENEFLNEEESLPSTEESTVEPTTESTETVETESAPALVDNMDKFLAVDPELLNKLIPLPALRSFKPQVDHIRTSYSRYRNHRTDLADIGTPKDTEDYKYYMEYIFTKYGPDRVDPNSTIIEEASEIEGNVESNVEVETVPVEETEELSDITTEEDSDLNKDIINTDKINQDTELVEKQINNPTNIPENPENTDDYEPVADNDNSELLDDYRGTSLTNIHAKKKTVNGKFEYQRDSSGKYEILPSYPKQALLPTVALPGSKIQVRVASREEYAKYADNFNVETVYNNPETLPLVAEQNGQFIGFILTPKGAISSSKRKLSKDDLNKLKAFREHVYTNQNDIFELNVQDKSMGVVTYRKDSEGKSIYRPIKEHLSKDGKTLAEGVHIVVDVNGVLHTHKGTDFTDPLINYSYGNGMIYTILPLANGENVKIPLRLSSITDSDADTVLEMFRHFIAHNRNPNDTGFVTSRNNIQNNFGINLANMQEFYYNVGNILHINTQGANQFFNRVKNDDNTSSYIIKAPSGANIKFHQNDFNNPNLLPSLRQFIVDNFYRGIKVQSMNNAKYNHFTIKDNKLTVDSYNTYTDYLLEKDVLLSDVYGEPIDNFSNKMSFVLAPFIKIAYPSVGNYTTVENTSTESNSIESQSTISTGTRSTTTSNSSFLGDIVQDNDDFDINFSLMDIKNDVDDIINPDIETEIDNFIKFCK